MNLHDSKHYSWYTTIFCDKLVQLPRNIKLIKTSFNYKFFSVITKKHIFTLVLSTLTRRNIVDVIITTNTSLQLLLLYFNRSVLRQCITVITA